MPTRSTAQPAFVPCVHLVAPRGLAPPRTCSRPRPRPQMRAAPNRRSFPAPAPDRGSGGGSPHDPAERGAKRWENVRKAVRASAVSLSVLLCSLGGVPGAGASPGGTVRVPQETAGDVEAAAVTLGAVTVGGLVMRAVLASRHNEEKEREKLAAECARLEQEEILHARRLKRKAMERVEGSEDLPEDDTLQSSLMKRLQDITSEDEEEVADETTDKYMRNTPIPDRGTGSMLLDRPDDAVAQDDSASPAGGEGEDDPDSVNPDRLEMLKRMWNMNSPDEEERKS